MAYTLQGQYGVVRFTPTTGTITNESKSRSGKLTSYAMENGTKISDHFERDPAKGSLKGVLIGGGAAVATLETMFDKGDIFTYTGSFRIENIVLTQLDFNTDSSNKKGFNFTASYQKADIVSAQYVEIGETQLMSEQDEGKSTAAQSSAKPAQAGLQTTVSETITSNAYSAYVESFNSKPAASEGPATRSTPTYNGY